MEQTIDALYAAIIEGNLPEVKSICSKGADVNTSSISAGYTPLHHAVTLDPKVGVPIIEVLLQNGADMNYSPDDESAFELANLLENTEAVKTMIRYGADIERAFSIFGGAVKRAEFLEREDLIELYVASKN